MSGKFVSQTEYNCITFTGKEEIILGELQDKFNSDNYPKIFSRFLSSLVESFNDCPLKDITTDPISFFKEMYVADILTILLSTRIAAYGFGIPLSAVCPCHLQQKIVAKREEEYHDLRELRIKIWQGEEAPVFAYELSEPVENLTVVELAPPTFAAICDPDFIQSELGYESKLAILMGNFDESDFEQFSQYDRRNIKYLAERLNTLGIDSTIIMYCDPCDRQWPIELSADKGYSDFYFSLLNPTRFEGKSVRESIYELLFFLSSGEQGPIKSPQEGEAFTPKIRGNWVKQLADSYAEQKRSLQKNK